MTSEIQAPNPIATIKAFLACIGRKDVMSMRKFIHPQATACLIREGEPRFQTLDAAIETLEKAEEELFETTWDEVEHVNGEYATVWASWSMHRDGKLIQLGSSSYSLWKDPNSGWIILTMSDIARSPDETTCT